MANTLLTPTQVTREALRILHQKLNFIGTINRQYDDSYALQGAKIGDTLKIRLPNQYTVRTGAALAAQDVAESSVSLQLATQKGVDVNFTSNELTLSLDDFSKRILQPAMSVLAANIEADTMSMYKDVPNQIQNLGAPIIFKNIMSGRKTMNDNLAPMDNRRSASLNTQDNLDLVDALKGLFHSSDQIEEQYREGKMGRTAGYDFYENTLWPKHTSGTDTSAYLSNGATQSGSSIIVDTGTGTFKKGDIITFAGVNSVHGETKVSTGVLKQFAIAADAGPTATTITITPALVATGATQNASTTIADNSAITKVGGNGVVYGISMLYHEDAFTFATADLVMPNGVDFAARDTYDGISMRIVRQYDIANDKFPCRIDVIYGFKTIRGELACRLAFN